MFFVLFLKITPQNYQKTDLRNSSFHFYYVNGKILYFCHNKT